MRFCVLASGSSGNASLLSEHGFGVLVDLGVGPRTLARRLEALGASWDEVGAAVLTHVHGDHWNENTLAHLYRHNIPLYCHRSHATALKYASPAFADMLDDDRLRFYEIDEEIDITHGIICRPLVLKHDSDVTCGFRFDGLGRSWSMGYAADLGTWDAELADALADVDVLAIEFNHDERMERQSGRGAHLIDRVLGDEGHLSNNQAADLLATVLSQSTLGRVRHLVQLHLSRQCNRPDLARAAAHQVLHKHAQPLAVHTAQQHRPSVWCHIQSASLVYRQSFFPGWELSHAVG